MSTRRAQAPIDLLHKDLAARPNGTLVVLVLDPDRLIEWSRSITDSKGRKWSLVVYRGDDVVTRRVWSKCRESQESVCLVLSRPEGDESVLDASYIADLVGRAEGDCIDLSLVGYFHTLFPRVNAPERALLDYRREFAENAPGFIRAYPKLKERWGEPDSWTRGQFLAIILLARREDLTLSDVWCDETGTEDFAAHLVWLLCERRFATEDLRLVADLAWESSRFSRESGGVAWADVRAEDLEEFRGEIAGYLVLRDTLTDTVEQHLDTLLRAKLHITTFDPEELGAIAPAVIGSLRDHGWWASVRVQADAFLTLDRASKLSELLAPKSQLVPQALCRPDTPPSLISHFVRQAIFDRFSGSDWPDWIEDLVKASSTRSPQSADEAGEAATTANALIEAAVLLREIESKLESPVADAKTPEELLDWYIANGIHVLEYKAADAYARLERVDDDELHTSGFTYIMMHPSGLRYRIRQYLDQLDRTLAAFIRADPLKFLQGPRSAIRILPNLLRSGRRTAGQRVWILILDGMRYDTWNAIVRPLLLEHFEVVDNQDRPYFSLLPSKTDIARRGLLAAALGKDWRNYFQKPTRDERILAAQAMGISKHDLDSRVSFVTDAETTEARQKLRRAESEARDVNVLIYPISDDLGHYHNDTLASLNEKVRTQFVTQQGCRGVIDDLRHRVHPDDIVLLTSDHGFQELLPEQHLSVTRLEARNAGGSDDDVVYRYLTLPNPPEFPEDRVLLVPWEALDRDGRKQSTTFCLAIGGTWFQRERGRPARFAHGGVSFAEMTIPGVLLRPIEVKAARVEFLDLPDEVFVDEDSRAEIAFELINSGNVDATFDVSASTNLDERVLKETGTLGPGKRKKYSMQITGYYKTDADRRGASSLPRPRPL